MQPGERSYNQEDAAFSVGFSPTVAAALIAW
jgi:hypothetical protein